MGFSFNIDLNKVYDIRAEFVKINIPLSGYFINWFAYIVNPVFFAIFLKKKKWLAVLLICFTEFIVFSATGNKTYLFALPFVLGLVWVLGRKNPLAWMAVGLVGFVLAGMLTFSISNNSWTYFLFTRRLMFVPAQLSFFYYDFFSQQQPLLLAQHSLFKNIVQYPYELDPPHLIADEYFGKPETNANNGIYADAYTNFHNAGFLIWGIALAVILSFFDSFSAKKDKKTAFAALAMPSIMFIETFFMTALVTHGVLFSLLLLYLLPNKEEEKI
ncbi:MAG TPA: hypothetical protein P5080_01815 [Candidatus Paceibacterota bacterium]|nr:hypothetical protein [Candidatus Pacearchaeota archaeon]HRZ50674.1 hypothetical protein [Candidatus Paceibacterota bacterium]HSA36429.1 hypothetical protein [Candidatus Paceibacterota bacterium]